VTEAEIRAGFQKRIAELPADDEMGRLRLQAEEGAAVAEFYRGEARRGELAQIKAEVLKSYPRARLDEVRGDSREEIEASAKASHDHVSAAIDEAIAAEKKRLEDEAGLSGYGRPGGGGTNPRPTPRDGEPDDLGKILDRMDAAVDSGKPISDQDFQGLISQYMEPVVARMDWGSFLNNPRVQERLQGQQAQLKKLQDYAQQQRINRGGS
jgi:hypothetical protein